jgi:hypothetical protein
MWPTHYLPNGNRGGVPPPRFYLTTPPYPVEVTEELSSAALFMFATPGIGAEDELEMAASFVSGSMTTFVFPTYAWTEELESAASFVSGNLVTLVFPTIEAGDELESAAQFVSGSMVRILVEYENWPLGADTEDLFCSASFVSGVMT